MKIKPEQLQLALTSFAGADMFNFCH